MRDFSKVGCGLWHSRKFRGMRGDHEARYTYLYLLTNPHSNSAGCYQLLEGYPVADMETTLEAYRKALDRLSIAGLIAFDSVSETILIHNWVVFNEPANAKHAIGILTQLQGASSEALKMQRFQEYEICITAKKMHNDKAAGYPLQRLMEAFREGIRTRPRPRERPELDQTETRPELEKENARASELTLNGSSRALPDEATETESAEVHPLLQTQLMRRTGR